MSCLEWIRFIIGAGLVTFGLFVSVTGVIGCFRFRYALERMHAAGLGDTLGLLSIFAGLAVLQGSIAFALKLAVILTVFWIASPTCSHLIMSMELRNDAPAGEDRKSSERSKS